MHVEGYNARVGALEVTVGGDDAEPLDVVGKRPPPARHPAEPATLRQAAHRWDLSVAIPQVIGTPEQVADRLETIWRDTGRWL